MFSSGTFGFRYFGLLSGIVLAVAGVVGFLQYPLSWLVESKGWRHTDVNYMQIGCFGAMYFFPLLVLRGECNERRARRRLAGVKRGGGW